MGAITVTNLGKAYKQYPTRWARLAEWLDPRDKPRHHLHWVLRDINFTVQPGEAVGIIGVNGAGKSTLLKMITGTTQPTTGTIEMQGRVAALLELGIGFHPEFTGRQNAVMAGQLLGYSLEEISDLMPQIEAFAEIGDYIDQPVRVYSSGMQMRLAFAVATARRPDILIIDEALSVGDAYFQHKSFDRIREFRKQGTTLLIVSHDKQAIQSICDRAILLSAGELAMEGEPEAVMDYYNALLSETHNQYIRQVVLQDGKTQTISGNGEAEITAIELLDEDGRVVEVVDVGQMLILRIEVRANRNLARLVLGYGVRDRLGQNMFGTNTDLTEQPLYDVGAGAAITYYIKFPANLGVGAYSVQVAIVADGSRLDNKYEWRDRALMFHVVNMTKHGFVGCLWMDQSIRIEMPSMHQNGQTMPVNQAGAKEVG
ncbi:ABC transporter ATP-binding protein [uncultured Pigmentiphaga sp.]|uniref:ABC transporter ATP-binding protein n=1 Tax=uncultured Pigmentiphaga sp. TaxID=340361 RepID=UPI00262B46B8|nr:ABC transporter ATP-binding protein [uncultured Pigmentiphaga sp.]